MVLPLSLYNEITILVCWYMGKKTPTSINIDEELWKEAKIEAVKRGITVTELLENALRNELKKK